MGVEYLLGVEDAAELLGVPEKRLARRWRDWGLPGLKVGGAVRFDPNALEEWLEQAKAVERRVGRKS